jgi:hypothetical protein
LDSLGYRISKELLENGYTVVVVESNRASPFIEEISNAGGILIYSNPFESKTLDKIGLAKSRACILANDKDEINIEIAANISLFNFQSDKKADNVEAMKLFIHIKDQQNKRVLKDYSDIDNIADNYDLPEKNINYTHRGIDDSIKIPIETSREKQVRFSPTTKELSPLSNNNEGIKDIHKTIILGTVFFLLFSDIKVKSYLINILVVIFGDFLRNSAGGTTKVGLVFYSILYGLTLFIITSIIDLSAFNFSF